MTETVKTLVAALDELALADLDQLTDDELRRLEGLLYHWQQLCVSRLNADRGLAP